MPRIAIVGLGLIGGSLGLALKAAKLPNVEIVGYDKDSSAMSKARKMGAVDKTAWTLRSAVEEAGMLIIATPVFAIRQVMEEVGEVLRPDCVVTDTGSTKAAVIRWAYEILPPPVSFVGGHPLAGKEKSGIEAAEATLFQERPYCLIPAPAASESAVRVVNGLISAVGARCVFVDAEEHDQYVAAISHVPLILSVALFTLVRDSASWPDMANLASSGFRDFTRLTGSDPTMSHDICLTNRQALSHWLDRFTGELSQYRELLQEGHEGDLFQRLTKAQMDRDSYISHSEAAPGPPGPEIPSLGDQLSSLFMGERLAQRAKDISKLLSGEIPRDKLERPPKREPPPKR
ncbi:MAG: prephenate dehydrogenase [Dehalococcoidia bacterium]